MKYLYIATSAFPGNSAYATRIDGITKALKSQGNQVTVLTDYSETGYGKQVFTDMVVIAGAKHRYPERTLFDKALAAMRMRRGLKRLLKKESFDCIIMSSIYMRVNQIQRMVRKSKTPLILESCEWFASYNWRRGKKSMEYKTYRKAWDNGFLKVEGTLAISRMLLRHYAYHKIPGIRIPTILDVQNTPYCLDTHNQKRKIIFVGSIAWGKDRVAEIIEALAKLDSLHYELHIYGPSEEAVRAQLQDPSVLEQTKEVVFIHGHIPHTEIPGKCQRADFGIILRPNRRQSHAGFPTKLAEYMAAGTPVIANDTGDIGLYVPQEFLLPTEFTVQDLVAMLKKIERLSDSELQRLRKEARENALQNFDYRMHAEEIDQFMRDVAQQYQKKEV